jgi:hypothetical protein
VVCGQGKSSAVIGATSSLACAPCTPGTSTGGLEGAETCSNCPAGSSAPSTGYAMCAACVPGTYSENGASTACTACDAGKYANQVGLDSCLVCDPGHFSGSGAVVCNACPGGTRSSDDLSECVDCEISKYERCPRERI